MPGGVVVCFRHHQDHYEYQIIDSQGVVLVKWSPVEDVEMIRSLEGFIGNPRK